MNNQHILDKPLKKYSFLKKDSYSFKNYKIVPIRFDDLLKIKNWRNEQLEILRQIKPLSDSDQLSYYETIIKKSFSEKQPKQILFSFLLNNECIGYGGLVHIDWIKNEAELSFLNKTKRSLDHTIFKNDFKIFLKLIFQIAFCELSIEKIKTEAYDIRKNLIMILEEIGFIFENKITSSVIINGSHHDSLLHIFHKKFYMDFKKKVNLNEN